MSKHLLSIMLGELQTARLICKGKKGECGTVIEVPIMGSSEMVHIQCPNCSSIYREQHKEGMPDPLRNMELALKATHSNFDVEFIIPAKD